MDELARLLHQQHVATVFPWEPNSHEEGNRLSAALRATGPNAPRSSRCMPVRHGSWESLQLTRSAWCSRTWLHCAQISGFELFSALSVELNTLASPRSNELAAHRTFVSNVLSPSLEVRRNAVLRKWVVARASAAEVLSFT